MDHLRVHQLDTIPIICRPQELVPFSRLGPYDPGLLHRVAYGDDEWLESWAHEAALIPMADEPLLRWRQKEMEGKGHWSGAGGEDYIDAVHADLKARGPLVAGQLDDPGSKVGTEHAWGGRSQGRMALGRLFAVGRAGSRRINNFERQYDTIERIVPEAIRNQPTPSIEESHRQLLRQASAAIGIGTLDDLADYYRIRVPQARPRVSELIEDGTLKEVEVEGWTKPGYRNTAAKLPRSIKASALLSPFDPVVWYRPRCERLFDFYYRIEIYVPENKRQFGYYVLPYLQGERIVGRVDVKADRKAGTLLVKGAWHEEHKDPSKIVTGLAGELSELARFQQLDEVVVTGKGNLSAALAQVCSN